MTIALTITAGEPNGMLEEFLHFHRAAGVDVAVVAAGTVGRV